MINYEPIPTLELTKENTLLKTHELPELVHFEDPALTVLIDFYHASSSTIKDTATLSEAIHDMELHDVQLLLVMNAEHQPIGLLTSEDVLGEKPIQYIQQNRLSHNHVLIPMLMTPIHKIPAFDIKVVEKTRVGNIVKTLHTLNAPTALVVKQEENQKIVLGAFTTAQISKQLHHNVRKRIPDIDSVSELADWQK